MAAHHFPEIRHRTLTVNGTRIFYRETMPAEADADTPPLLLLHGFPSASHQFRRLIDALGGHRRIIAPDYPGFGHSDMPHPSSLGGDFTYSFDRLADVMEGFVDALGLRRFIMYVFDFGAPIGLRLAVRRPEWIAGLIVQNGNLYEEAFSESARQLIALQPHEPGAEQAVNGLLTIEATRHQYESGTSDPELVAPDGWTLDQHFLDLPGRKQPQADLLFDYKNNVARYPEWQRWLRDHQPPALVVWGRYDPFFGEPGAQAYRRDLPEAEIHVLDTGHFALEEKLPEIVMLIDGFLDRLGTRGHPDGGRAD